MKSSKIIIAAFVVVSTLLCGQTASSNAEAQKAYNQGVELMKSAGVKPVEKALESFKQAVALYPQFAAAHAQMSLAYSSLGGNYNYWSPERTGPQSVQAAERALALNDRLPDAHLAMAVAKRSFQWDWAGAEQAYKRAVGLKPETSDAFLEYAFFLVDTDRPAEADAMFQKASELGVPPWLANIYKVARTSDRRVLTQLVESQEKELAQRPRTAYGLWQQAFASTKARNWAAAEKYLLEQIPLMEGDIVDEVALLGHVYGRMGRKADALKRLAQLDVLERSNLYVSPVLRAWIQIGLGEKDRAFSYLDTAMAQRGYRLGLDVKGFGFLYDPIRNDARFAALMKKLKL